MRDEQSLERLLDLGCQSPRRVVPRPCHRTTVLSHPVALLHTAHCTLLPSLVVEWCRSELILIAR
jgi:hypothetical protein